MQPQNRLIARRACQRRKRRAAFLPSVCLAARLLRGARFSSSAQCADARRNPCRAVADVPLSLGISHCGLLTVSVDRADVRDVFGLCSFAVRADCARDTWVPPSCFPAQVALEAFPAHAQEDSRFSAVRRGEDFSETQSIRPYVPGDPGAPDSLEAFSQNRADASARNRPAADGRYSARSGRRWRGHTRRGGSVALPVCSPLPVLSWSRGVAHRVSFWRGRRCPSHPLRTGNGRRAMLSSTPPDPSAESGFERVAVFSPRADVDVSDACARVTLVLPQDAQALVGDVPRRVFRRTMRRFSPSRKEPPCD